ncbi:hypothetical protein [Nocardia wallacei]|uniref:hypothetical protein n=1 Tax=Nocardia wallacei TaxID=480035 RepID=UPI0024587BBF|nr:hypothetical protein [Nocardia wallacei]
MSPAVPFAGLPGDCGALDMSRCALLAYVDDAGHVTCLSALPEARTAALLRRLADAWDAPGGDAV